MQLLEFKILIDAAAEKVWKIMLDEKTYKDWVDAAWPGSGYSGKWGKNEKIRFGSADGSGTLAVINEFIPYRTIEAEHIAILLPGGKEDRDTDIAKGWIGTKETYFFNEKNGQTELVVHLEINPEWAEMFNEGWPKALKRLKEITE